MPPSSSVTPPGGSSGGIVKPGGGGSSVGGVKPLGYGQDANGNCFNYGAWNYRGFEECKSPKQLEDLKTREKLAWDIATGNDVEGKKTRQLAGLLLDEAERIAGSGRFDGFGGSENVQYIKVLRAFIQDAAVAMPPSEILAIALSLSQFMLTEQPQQVAIRLKAVARELKNVNGQLATAAKNCRSDARRCGDLPESGLRQGTAAVLYAAGFYDDMDVTRFTTPIQAFFQDGFWDVFNLVTFGQGLAGVLKGFSRGGASGIADGIEGAAARGARGRGSSWGRALEGCNSFSANTKVWVSRAAQDVAKVSKAGQTLASRASSAVKGAKAVLATLAISSVAIGTPVLAFNEQSKQQEIQPVTATISHGKKDQNVVTLKLETNDHKTEILDTTPEHPFAVRVGQDGQIAWVNAIDLTKGQSIARADGKSGRLISRSVEARDVQLYNLTVAQAHTYFVGDGQWLVHNAGGCPTLLDDPYNPNAVLARSERTNDVIEALASTGTPPAGYRGGGTFQNLGRNGEQVLPKIDSMGNPITYRQYDVNVYTPGVNRGAERIVIGSDGRIYATADHYKTFYSVTPR